MEKETLEEAAEKEYPIHNALQHSTEYKANIAEKRLAFIFGAKWQAERMYSEEEVLKLVDGAFHMYASSHRHDAKEWLIEEFKKK